MATLQSAHTLVCLYAHTHTKTNKHKDPETEILLYAQSLYMDVVLSHFFKNEGSLLDKLSVLAGSFQTSQTVLEVLWRHCG